MSSGVTEADFVSYVRFRTLDSIGTPGVYKRFVYSRKEQCVQWAIDMCASVTAVQSAVKELTVYGMELRKSPLLATLCPVWQYVVDLSMPPTDLPVVIGQCYITGRQDIPCTLLRCKG